MGAVLYAVGWLFNNIPGLSSLDSSNMPTPTSSGNDQKCHQTLPVFAGGLNPPGLRTTALVELKWFEYFLSAFGATPAQIREQWEGDGNASELCMILFDWGSGRSCGVCSPALGTPDLSSL